MRLSWKPDDRPVVIVNHSSLIQHKTKPKGKWRRDRKREAFDSSTLCLRWKSRRWITFMCAAVSFCSLIIWLVFTAAAENKCLENSSLVAKWFLVVEWSALLLTTHLLFRPLHSVCYFGANHVPSKPRSVQGFHSNLAACDRLKMKGYKSLPGWPWGLATVILWAGIWPKTCVAWHPDIFSVLFHCEVSNISEMWWKQSCIKSITLELREWARS